MKGGYLSLAVTVALTGLMLLAGCDNKMEAPTEIENKAPVIDSLTVDSLSISAGNSTAMNVAAHDPDGDSLDVAWSAASGSFPDGVEGTSVVWQAPADTGNAMVTVYVNDGMAFTVDSIRVTVLPGPDLVGPPVPYDPSPQDGEENVSTLQTLSWAINVSDEDSVRFDVFLGTESPLPMVSSDQLEREFVLLNSLEHETTYSWKVIARDTLGYSTNGPVWTFTTVPPGNQPPQEPENVNPQNEQQDVPLEVTLVWSCVDPDGDELVYDLYFGVESPPELVSSSLSDTTYSLDSLNAETSYYWRIVARDPENAETSGPEWYFRTEDSGNRAPDPPILIAPVDNAQSVWVNASLSWSCSDPDGDEMLYSVYIGEDPENLVREVVFLADTTYLTSTLDFGSIYYWQIVAIDDHLNETASEIYSFSTHEAMFEEQDFYLGNTGEQITMTWIPPGTFLMGSSDSDPDGVGEEKPQHEVTISYGFWLSKYELTQTQWEAVTGSNPSEMRGPDKPVNNVNWFDCKDFIEQLNAMEEDEPWRLPSEAEWEHAARADINTRFPWGDDPAYLRVGDYAWFDSNADHTVHNVGEKLPNQFGLYDIFGNVWEWVEDDWHDNYDGAPTDGSAWVENPRDNDYRSAHGGSWYGAANDTRPARRRRRQPTLGGNAIGLRLVRVSE